MGNIVIFGTGDVGQLAHFYLTHDSPHQVVAFCADREHLEEREVLGLPVIAFEEIQDMHPPQECEMFVALSYKNLNEIRKRKYFEAKEKGYRLISYVCSRSVFWGNPDIGDNCFIFENQTIQPFVRIGNNVTLWSGNHIGHHSTIADHCFVTSHVVVSGHVDIGESCFLGVNATLRDGIKLAPRSVIGSGATIVKDTIEKGVYTGVAASLREKEGDKLKYFTQTKYEERD
ncbi:MAG: transferase [Gemmatimonadetes bacterium]|nr:transferase [Gemmatimonadota bacterium]|tara:strand:- start:2506 stop:3195 length:690 start_codon:yes stop_codon:yes gene_type:complete